MGVHDEELGLGLFKEVIYEVDVRKLPILLCQQFVEAFEEVGAIYDPEHDVHRMVVREWAKASADQRRTSDQYVNRAAEVLARTGKIDRWNWNLAAYSRVEPIERRVRATQSPDLSL